jgi:hypothetical protein
MSHGDIGIWILELRNIGINEFTLEICPNIYRLKE